MTVPDVVDIVATSPDGTMVGLTMIETRPWDGGTRQLLELQAKLNGYITYVLEGQLAKEHPDSADKQPVIVLQCADEPTEDVQAFLNEAEDLLQARGIRLDVWPGLAP